MNLTLFLHWPSSSICSSNDISLTSAKVSAHVPPSHLQLSQRLFVGRQATDVPILCNAFVIQRFANIIIKILEKLDHELTGRHFPSTVRVGATAAVTVELPHSTPDTLADIVNMISATNFQDFPFCLTSQDSQTDLVAWRFLYLTESDSVCSLCGEFLTYVQTSPCPLASLLRPFSFLGLVAPIFYYRPYAMSPLCDRVFSHNSSSNGR